MYCVINNEVILLAVINFEKSSSSSLRSKSLDEHHLQKFKKFSHLG